MTISQFYLKENHNWTNSQRSAGRSTDDYLSEYQLRPPLLHRFGFILLIGILMILLLIIDNNIFTHATKTTTNSAQR